MRLLLHLASRFLQLALLVYLVTSASFFLTSLLPGDFFTILEANPDISRETIEQLRSQYGLTDPLWVRYGRWLRNSLQLNFGVSLYYGKPVVQVVSEALINTLWIGLPALALGLAAGVALGTLHAVQKDRLLGYLFDTISAVLLSLPPLILGIAALILASRSRWFPLGGMNSVDLTGGSGLLWVLDRLHHLALPTLCLALPVLATAERIQFAAALHALHEPFVRSAKARGLPASKIFLRYLVRPSLNPILSTLGPMLAGVLSGSLVLELIFSWPGLGKVTYDGLFNRDVFLVLGCVALAGTMLVLGNLVADMLLYLMEPRTRRQAAGETL